MSTIDIRGTCPPRFAAVRDAFAANFEDAPEGLNEIGARFSVCIEGEPVIDLMGGHADTARTRPFEARTLVPVFSTGKAVMALMIATLIERGLATYDDPVARHWPAFGQAGKDRITIAQLMSHQAGLPGFSDAIDPALWFDRDAVLDRLCRQTPMWPPGTASGYHPVTIGYLAGELFRRLDGRSMGLALRQDFAGPFALDLWIGLPQTEHDRVAQMRKPAAAPDLGPIDAVKTSAFLDRGSSPGGRGTADWRMAEIPSANLHGTALDLARLMSVLATGGRLEGRTILSPDTLSRATEIRIQGSDRVLPFDLAWAAGWMRNFTLDDGQAETGIFGPSRDALGHYGWGGSCAWADASNGLSAAYVMTRQSPHLVGDPRAVRLADALYRSLR